MSKSVNLFLDDTRTPFDIARTPGTIKSNIYKDYEWTIVKSHTEFIKFIVASADLPDMISFDHDLCMAHTMSATERERISDSDINYFERFYYNKFLESTGYDSAKWLVKYCTDHRYQLPFCFVHSYSHVANRNILTALDKFYKIEKTIGRSQNYML